MKDSTLLAFQRVAEAKSMTAAAKELYISTPSLKQSMDGLEKEVGFPVFVRTHSGVYLTEEGKMFYEGSKKLMVDYRELLQSCRKSFDRKEKTLRIGVAVPSTLSTLCNAYTKEHPNVRFQYFALADKNPQGMMSMLKSGQIDLLEFMDMGISGQDEIGFLPVLQDKLYALVSYSNPLSDKDMIDLEKISGQTVYIADADIYSIPTLTAFFRDNNPGIVLRTTRYTDMEIMNACTSDGFYLMEYFYAQKFANLKLVPLLQSITFYAGIAYRKKCISFVQEFLDYCMASVGKL